MKLLAFIATLLAAIFAANFAFAANQIQDCYQSNPNNFPNTGNCSPAIQASKSVAISIASSTTTQLVALATNQAIYITSFDFMGSSTNNVTLVYGTGSNCATGQVALTGAYPLTTQAGLAKGNGLGPVLYIPKGNALCITTSDSGQLSGSVSYVQF